MRTTGLSQWRAGTGNNLFASVPNLKITMKTLILAAIRYSLMLLPECGLMPLSVPAPEKPLCTQPVTSCTRSRLTRRLVKYFAQMRRPSSYTSVVKIGLHVYEVRPCEGHRNVGFRCAAVWPAVVAKVTGAIGYARHQAVHVML